MDYVHILKGTRHLIRLPYFSIWKVQRIFIFLYDDKFNKIWWNLNKFLKSSKCLLSEELKTSQLILAIYIAIPWILGSNSKLLRFNLDTSLSILRKKVGRLVLRIWKSPWVFGVVLVFAFLHGKWINWLCCFFHPP